MRQFLLAGAAAYSAATTAQAVAAGAIAFFYQNAGVPTPTATGTEILGMADLILGRTSALGGPVILPIYKNDFTFSKGEYQAATTFQATIVIPAPVAQGDYTLIVALKGAKFNERNKFSASTYFKTGSGMTAATLATALAAQINASTVSSGVTATVGTATITITATKPGVDYAIIAADHLWDVQPTYVAKGIPAYGDAAYVQDLANKAAADKGFSYTWSEDRDLLYPNYDVDPLAQPPAADVGYTIFTLRFAEPRLVKTRDEVVHQIVQVAFPTGGAAIATFETVCESLSGVPAPVVP